MSTLREQLERFHAAVTGRTPLTDARDLVERGELEGVDEIGRLHVYEYAYIVRIASVLVADYPKLAHLVGEPELRSWTAGYLRAYPPSSFTLREVGAHLARWILESANERNARRIARDDDPRLSHDDDPRRLSHDDDPRRTARDDDPPAPRLLADLARLERARIEVFDGPDATALSRDDLATMGPEDFPSLPLRLIPSSRVVTLETTADDVWDAIENDGQNDGQNGGQNDGQNGGQNDGQSSDETHAEHRVVLVWRRDLKVFHRTLDADEARIVPAMIAGTTFGGACELLDEATAAERAIELLVRWLDAQILTRP